MKSVTYDNEAIAAMCGLKAEQIYIDVARENDPEHCDDDDVRQIVVEREGFDVFVLMTENGRYCHLYTAELTSLIKALSQAQADAGRFFKASRKWSEQRFENLECDFRGRQTKSGYRFDDVGNEYEVQLSLDKKTRHAEVFENGVLMSQSDSEDADISHAAAASVLKAALIAKRLKASETTAA